MSIYTCKDAKKASASTTTQTVRIAGVRTKITTRNGKVTAAAALPLEWKLQAAAVRALKAMPEFGRQFLLAGDQAAGKRGPKAQMQALATGLTPGDPDLRINLPEGRTAFIEYKTTATTEDACAAATVALVRGWLTANTNKQNNAKALDCA